KKELKFPGLVSMTATFRCVRVRSNDDWVNELAYHASVRIGGHVFCGLLHDQGPSLAQTSSVPLLQHNNLINVATQTTHNIDAATMAPPLSSSSARDSIFHPTYPFPLPPSMPYFSNPQP
ncbi:protein SHORT INTERNODES-like, partial [Neltuma alba]|uniref:protein SHORT INTERNODES-like n=1 Tax=Neltuma alba TaxID=207710 RepID=UPI0010A52951